MIEPLPSNLLREPLDFLSADHERVRSACRLLSSLAGAARTRGSVTPAAALLAFIEHELPLHYFDEELDLFPSLRLRCAQEQDVVSMLVTFSAEHGEDNEAAASLASHLRAVVEGRATLAEPAFVSEARRFSLAQERHANWEDILVLPLARRRLTPPDLARMGRRMAERRNLVIPH